MRNVILLSRENSVKQIICISSFCHSYFTLCGDSNSWLLSDH